MSDAFDVNGRTFLAAALLLAACKSEPRASSVEPARTELVYWSGANPNEVGLATELTALYNDTHTDVRVSVHPIPAGRSAEEVLLAAIVGRTTPDVCSNVSTALLARLVRAHGVARLDTLEPTRKRLEERASAPMLAPLRMPDGGIYALPWKTNPLMLMYNVDQLAAAKVAPPKNHSDLGDAFRRLARDADGDGRLDHWAMWANVKSTWFERFYDLYPLYLAGSGGTTLLTGGEVAFDNEAAVAAIDVFRKGFSGGFLPRTNFEGRDPFVDGTVAMKIIGPWFLEELERMKVMGLNYDVVPIPVPDGLSPETAYSFGDVKSIAIFSNSRHPEAAAEFVAFLSGPEADKRLVERAAQLPYRTGLASDARFTAALGRWHTLDKYAARVERLRDVDPDPDIVEAFDILSEAYEASAIHDTVPTRTAVHEAAREVTGVIHAR